ncbi:hypothetical protein D3C73_1236490 [compost metagenome]
MPHWSLNFFSSTLASPMDWLTNASAFWPVYQAVPVHTAPRTTTTPTNADFFIATLYFFEWIDAQRL